MIDNNEKLKQKYNNFATEYQAKSDIIKNREDVCNDCNLQVLILGVKVCSNCNCVLALKQKLKHSKCPIGKW